MKRIKLSIALVLSAALLVSAVSSGNPVAGAAEAADSLSKPTVNSSRMVTWDCVYFGKYWQEDTNGDNKVTEEDEKTPIKWRVLTVEGDYALLLSEQILDWMTFHKNYSEVGWENSDIRQYLNQYFCPQAFDYKTEIEKGIKLTVVEGEDNSATYAKGDRAVQDKVFLLSYSQATKAEYGFDTAIDTKSKTRCAEKTGYALAQAGGINTDKWWWLRTQGSDKKHMIVIRGEEGNAVSDSRKGMNGQMVHKNAGVRPALWLNMKECSTWKKAGTVTAASRLSTAKSPVSDKNTNTGKKPPANTTSATVKKAEKEVIKGKAPKVSYKAKTGRLIVKYKAPKKTAGFQIRYKIGKGKWKVKTYKTKKSVSKTLRGLKKGKYTVQVRSFTKGKKTYSKWSKAKKIKIKRTAAKAPAATDEK